MTAPEASTLAFGATGALGRHVLDALVARGISPETITAVGRNQERLGELDDDRFEIGLVEGLRAVISGAGAGEPEALPRAVPVSGQRFWINTVSLDHVEAAIQGGFTQADHGAGTRLRQPRPGDQMVFYSPRTNLRGGKPVRQFTAWATITGDKPYQVQVSDDFRPWRLAVTFHACERVDAKPLADQLSFISDPAHWGLPFRRGLFHIPRRDFSTITEHMIARGDTEPQNRRRTMGE